MAVLAKISARQLLLLDLNLDKVNNWGATSAVNDPSDITYATAGAVKKAYDLAAAALPAKSNAVSASKLFTARTISLTGDATGNGTFDGSANLSIALALKASGVTAGTYRSVTVDAKGIVTGGTNPTTLAGYGITDALGIKDNAVSASKLATARTISLTGDATGTGTFDGSANLSIALTAKDTGVVAGTYSTVTVDAKGRVTGGAALASADLPASGVTAGTYRSVTVDSKGIVTDGTNPTTLAGYGITDALGIKDNAVSASKLATARTISFTGDATGSGSFDGSGNLTINLSGRASGVTAGTYRSVTVDVRGDVTAGSNPTTLAGYGITDAAPSSHVSAGGNAHAAATTTLAGFMSAADKAKLDGIASSATNYTHPSGDGNLHVPATGTTSNGKVLRAGASAGSLSWATLAPADVGALPDTGGGMKGNFWRESGGKQFGLTAHLGSTIEAKPNLILLAKKYVSTFVAKTGFIGRIMFERGSNTANLRNYFVDVNVVVAYQTNQASILYRSPGNLSEIKIVEVTYNSEVYYALYRGSYTTSNSEVIVDGHSFGGGLPLLIPDASAYTIKDVVTTDDLYHVNNKPTSADVGLGNLDNAKQMRATLLNGYWGLTDGAGSSSAYIRTTSSGIIPYQSGTSSALGTSTWQFNTAYVKTIYEDGASLVTKYLGISDNAVSATKLATARTLTVGLSGKTFDGSANVSWSLADIGALPLTGGTLTGALNLPNGRTLRIASSTTNPGLLLSSESGLAMLWRDPTADEAAAGKAMEFIGINRSSQLIFRQDKGTGDGKYGDYAVYHTGYKPTAADVGALPAVGGNATGNVFVDKGTTTEPNLGVKRDSRLLYLYDTGTHQGLHSSGLSGKVNASLIRRSVVTGDIDIGSTLDAGGIVTMYGDPRSAVAQGTNAASLVRKDYADAQFVSGTGGTGIGNNPLLETTTGGVRDFDLAKTNGTFTVAGGWLNGTTNVGATAVTHTGTLDVSQRLWDNQTVQTYTQTAVIEGIRIQNSSTRVYVSASEGWSPWFKSGMYESINIYRAGIFRLNAEGANGPDANYPYYTLTKEKFRTDTTSYYSIGEIGFRVNAPNRYDPHSADMLGRMTVQVKPNGDEQEGRMYIASRYRNAAGGTADGCVLSMDRDGGAVFTNGGKSVSMKTGTITSVNAVVTGDSWKESGTRRYAMISKLGAINSKNALVLLAKKYVGTNIAKSGFTGRITLDRGATNSNLIADYIDLSVVVGYNTNSVSILYRTGGFLAKAKIVEVTYSGDVYYALYIPSVPLCDVIADGNAFDADLPLFIADAASYSLTDVATDDVLYHTGNKPTAADVGALAANANAVSASKLATARTISFTGDATGSGTFDGSGNLSINLTGRSSGVKAGTYRSVTVDVRGDVTAGTNPTTLSGYGITDALGINDNAVSASKLATARTLTIGNVARTFDGSANVTWTLGDLGAAPSGFGLGDYGKMISTVLGDNNLRRESGFFQGSNIAGIPVGGHTWNYIFSQAHNNNAGYFGYLAINYNGSMAWVGGQEAGNQKGPFQVVLDNSPNTYNTIKMSNWFRSTGDTGWFNETYGGGIYMIDSLYVRIYNNKRFHVPNTADDAINVAGGIWMGGLLQAANMRLAGAAWINGGQPVEGNALTRKDYVDNKTWAAWQGNQDVITGGWAQVGSYLMCAVHTNAGIPGLNNLISGAYLVPSGAGKKSYEGSGSIPGTWRQMGALGSSNTDSEWDDRTTLFFRVA
ncbi:hypothetical protein [Leclercia adecarboxylata]|uniref:hypothetical protein n=1 Tax=Leclercia adecarboxylata TaxID=83655 RepID=UPI0013C72617|nr:hypothetical protein [Leclercia adecarboxylata]NEG94393.1 hypothetical protein [Leclercia adecarboxylata]